MFSRGSRFHARRRWAGRVCVWAYSVAVLQGCYVYTVPAAAPTAGTPLRVEVNDNGRVGLGGTLGPAVRTVEGTTISNTDSAFQLRVSKVGYLSGQSTKWTGESLTIRRSFIMDVRERQFSRSRTWAVTAGVLAAVGAFVASRGLLGLGNDGRDPAPPIPPVQ